MEGKIHIHNVPRIIMATCFDEITERKETTYLLFSCIINNVSFKGLQEATHDRDAKFDIQKFEGEYEQNKRKGEI